MKEQTANTKVSWVLLPILGTVLFIIFFIVASLLYPGGSQADKNSVGFSWANNYWCNLINETAVNGQPNVARPVAMTGMFVLCCTLALFWYNFPKYTGFKKVVRLTIQVSGIFAMAIAMLISSAALHDIVLNVASILAMIAFTGTFIGLYKMKWYKLLWFGFFNILLAGLNSYVYYTTALIIYLPVIQKITFSSFLLLICCICIKLYRQENKILQPLLVA